MPTTVLLTDTKVKTELEVYPTIKVAFLTYVESTRTRCWGLVEAAIGAKDRGIDEAGIRAMFNKALAEICDVKSTEYATYRPLGAKAAKIAYNVTPKKIVSWKEGNKGFNALYESVTKRAPMEARPGGNTNSKKDFEEGVKEGAANADAYLGSLMKGKANTNTTNDEKEDKSRGWTAPEVRGDKPAVDLWYKETKATLTDTPNKFMDAMTKLAKHDILTCSIMVDLIESYIGDDIDEMDSRWRELVDSLCKSSEEALTTIKAYGTKVRQSEEDDSDYEMRKINATNKKTVASKHKRG